MDFNMADIGTFLSITHP